MANFLSNTTPDTLTSTNLMFRGPSTSSPIPETSFVPPSLDFLQGTWYVTHSTLPMWESSRNVTITYTALDNPSGAIDDLVRYQPVTSDKVKTVHGTDRPDPDVQAKYTWRGRSWLKIASSKWEILGYGKEEGGWAVTYFAKTLFTPAGIDIYARERAGLSAKLLDKIKANMKRVDDHTFRTMVDKLFEIQHDQK